MSYVWLWQYNSTLFGKKVLWSSPSSTGHLWIRIMKKINDNIQLNSLGLMILSFLSCRAILNDHLLTLFKFSLADDNNFHMDFFEISDLFSNVFVIHTIYVEKERFMLCNYQFYIEITSSTTVWSLRSGEIILVDIFGIL